MFVPCDTGVVPPDLWTERISDLEQSSRLGPDGQSVMVRQYLKVIQPLLPEVCVLLAD